ncbi:MAG: LysR family transcriptional regulator [Anaerocolumna sp.]
MKIFVSVCQEKSVSLAAKKLYISQPAVSNAIKELEEHYGTPLFDRISKKLYLTEAGKKILSYALHINSLFEELETTIKNSSAMGKLKIGSSITIGTHHMPGYIKVFSQRFPNVQTYVTIDSSDVIEKSVLDNKLDFALIEGAVHSDNIISKDFIEDELIIICDIDNPLLQKKIVSVYDLTTQNFLMRERNSGTRELAESVLLLHNIPLKPIWESSSTAAIIHGVSKGIGISILPLQLVQDYIDRNQINKLEVDGLKFKRQYHIIYHKNKYLTQASLDFINLCLTT